MTLRQHPAATIAAAQRDHRAADYAREQRINELEALIWRHREAIGTTDAWIADCRERADYHEDLARRYERDRARPASDG